MAQYPKSAYGSHNPNSGRPANGDCNAWGGYQYPAGVPSSLMGKTSYVNRGNGQTMAVSMRKELVPLWNLAFEICDRKHGYPVWANRNGENWGPWGYQNRAVSGTNTPSGHSMALSVDMNAPYNGYSSTWQCDMPPAMVADLEALGLYWGGRYSGKYDPMHYGYCYPPSSVSGHVSKARSLLGGSGGGGGQPVVPETPVPVPPIDWTEMTLRACHLDSGGTIFAYGPGVFEGIPSMEFLEVSRAAKLIEGDTYVTNQRGLDVLRDMCLRNSAQSYQPEKNAVKEYAQANPRTLSSD